MWLLGDEIWVMIYNYKNWNRESDHILLTNYANLKRKKVHAIMKVSDCEKSSLLIETYSSK